MPAIPLPCGCAATSRSGPLNPVSEAMPLLLVINTFSLELASGMHSIADVMHCMDKRQGAAAEQVHKVQC